VRSALIGWRSSGALNLSPPPIGPFSSGASAVRFRPRANGLRGVRFVGMRCENLCDWRSVLPVLGRRCAMRACHVTEVHSAMLVVPLSLSAPSAFLPCELVVGTVLVL